MSPRISFGEELKSTWEVIVHATAKNSNPYVDVEIKSYFENDFSPDLIKLFKFNVRVLPYGAEMTSFHNPVGWSKPFCLFEHDMNFKSPVTEKLKEFHLNSGTIKLYLKAEIKTVKVVNTVEKN